MPKELTYANSLKINKGNYEQESPMFSIKSIGEFDENVEYERLKAIVDSKLAEHWDKAKLDMSGVRVRVKDGKKYPSVTSILQPEQLKIDALYGLRGSEIHRLVTEYVKSGVWQEPTEVLSDKIRYDQILYKEFFEKYKKNLNLIDSETNIECFNDDYLYSGEIDFIGTLDGVETLADFKTGSWDWTQLAAYYKAIKRGKQLAIFDLKNCKIETLQLKDAVKYWEQFLIKRGEFKSKFGI